MKKDATRGILSKAIEAYDLMATPPPQAIYRDATPERVSNPEDRPLPDDRQFLQDYAIDLKYIWCKFINGLASNHGMKRAERYIQWTMEGYLERYTYSHRQMLLSDRKRLKHLFDAYKRNKIMPASY